MLTLNYIVSLSSQSVIYCFVKPTVQNLLVCRIAMLFSGSRRKKVIGSSHSDLYDHCLQFYAQPPLENISLTEFETFAVERLKCKSLFMEI